MADIKKIKIFLASSIEEKALQKDRTQIGDFIGELNNAYNDKGIYFLLKKCEYYSNSIVMGGSQEALNDEIRDSELVFFIFFKKVGDYTKTEFEVALDAFKSNDKPQILTFFRYVKSIDDATDDVKAFMRMLGEELKHYYNIYNHIDTLKLRIAIKIADMKLDIDEPGIEADEVKIGSVSVGSVSNIPMLSENKSIEELKEELEYVTEDYEIAQARYLKNKQNRYNYENYRRLAEQKADIEQRLRLAERAVLEAIKVMYVKT